MRHLSTDLRRYHSTDSSLTSSNSKPKRYRHPHLPPLFYSVQNRTWHDVLRRSRTHPHEIVTQEDISGNTPLHIACRLDPPAEVIRALRAAGKERNAEGATPLHVAASHRCSADVISALIQNNEESEEGGEEAVEKEDGTQPSNGGEVEKAEAKHTHKNKKSHPSATAALTRMGRSPIHYACMSFRGLSVDAFRVLLEATVLSGQVDSAVPEEDDATAVMGKSGYETESDDGYELPEEEAAHDVNAVTMRDVTGQTPLALLFRRYRERVRCVIKMLESHNNSTSSSMADGTPNMAAAQAIQADLGELWEKARLLIGTMADMQCGDISDVITLDSCANPTEAAQALEAAAWARARQNSFQGGHPHSRGSGSSARVGTARKKFRIVHASVGLTGYGCPPEMIRLAVSIHPYQVREMDEDGNLPLHIAAVASSYAGAEEGAGGGGENASASAVSASDEDSIITDFSFLSNAASTKAFDKVIQLLLRHYPTAARIPHGRTGRLPFVLAVEAGRRTWDDGIQTMLDAYPAALESREVCVKLYPYILRMVGGDVDGLSSIDISAVTGFFKRSKQSSSSSKSRRKVNTMFELVRAKPDVMRDAVYAAKKKKTKKGLGGRNRKGRRSRSPLFEGRGPRSLLGRTVPSFLAPISLAE